MKLSKRARIARRQQSATRHRISAQIQMKLAAAVYENAYRVYATCIQDLEHVRARMKEISSRSSRGKLGTQLELSKANYSSGLIEESATVRRPFRTWQEIAFEASREKDPKRLLELTKQLEQALDARDQELRNPTPPR